MKTLFEKEYNSFGGVYPELNISEGYLPSIKYKYSVCDNVLSIVVQRYAAVINGDGFAKLYIYNINLTTLEKASLKDIYKVAGFNSENELK